jgi:hypothetical protein
MGNYMIIFDGYGVQVVLTRELRFWTLDVLDGDSYNLAKCSLHKAPDGMLLGSHEEYKLDLETDVISKITRSIGYERVFPHVPFPAE